MIHEKAERIIQNPERNEAVRVAVLGHITLETTLSIARVLEGSGVWCRTVQRISKLHKFYRYKIKLVQKPNEDHNNRRLKICKVTS